MSEENDEIDLIDAENVEQTGQTGQGKEPPTVKRPIHETWVEVSQDENGKWHWGIWSPAGNIEAVGTKNYGTKHAAIEAFQDFKGRLATVDQILAARPTHSEQGKPQKKA